MPFTDPNYTQIPNDLLGNRDEPGLMADMTLAELKLILAVCRLTIGYHDKATRITYRKLAKMAGLSPESVRVGIGKLAARGLVRKDTSKGVTLWILDRRVPDSGTRVPESSTPSIKETLQRKDAEKRPSAWTRHPAVQAYRKETHYYPGGEWNKVVAETVGDNGLNVETWRSVCHKWVGMGWNPRNVKGMLDALRSGGIKPRASKQSTLDHTAEVLEGFARRHGIATG